MHTVTANKDLIRFFVVCFYLQFVVEFELFDTKINLLLFYFS